MCDMVQVRMSGFMIVDAFEWFVLLGIVALAFSSANFCVHRLLEIDQSIVSGTSMRSAQVEDCLVFARYQHESFLYNLRHLLRIALGGEVEMDFDCQEQWLLQGEAGTRNQVLLTHVSPVIMMLWIVVSVVLALNMLIAMMNKSFDKVYLRDDLFMGRAFTQQVLSWDMKPPAPPPLSVLLLPYDMYKLGSHAVRSIFKSVCGRINVGGGRSSLGYGPLDDKKEEFKVSRTSQKYLVEQFESKMNEEVQRFEHQPLSHEEALGDTLKQMERRLDQKLAPLNDVMLSESRVGEQQPLSRSVQPSSTVPSARSPGNMPGNMACLSWDHSGTNRAAAADRRILDAVRQAADAAGRQATKSLEGKLDKILDKLASLEKAHTDLEKQVGREARDSRPNFLRERSPSSDATRQSERLGDVSSPDHPAEAPSASEARQPPFSIEPPSSVATQSPPPAHHPGGTTAAGATVTFSQPYQASLPVLNRHLQPGQWTPQPRQQPRSIHTPRQRQTASPRVASRPTSRPSASCQRPSPVSIPTGSRSNCYAEPGTTRPLTDDQRHSA